MRIQDAYTRWANTYDVDLNLTRDLDQVITKKSLEHLRFHTTLEIGCGTGKNTSLLSQLSKHVVAFDFSIGMLSKAKTKIARSNVSFAVADLVGIWPCKPASIELIACNLVLEHIEDLLLIFGEAQRVLTSKGRFFISELHPFRQYQGTQANFESANERIEIQAFVHHLSDFAEAAAQCGLFLEVFNEWWDEADRKKPPRLVSFMFQKR